MRCRSSIATVIVFGILSTGGSVWAQKGGGAGGGSTSPGSNGGSPGGAPGAPGGVNNPLNTRSPVNQTTTGLPDMRRGIFLSGIVQMEDGTPPPQAVVIERVCNGTPRPEAYTDNKGRFSFQVGGQSDVVFDASSPVMPINGVTTATSQTPFGSNMGNNPYSVRDCDLRARLAGFRSDEVSLMDRRSLDNPNVGTIYLHPLARVNGYTFSATSALAPKSAQKAFGKGVSKAKEEKWADAEKEFTKATDEYPRYALAWYNLGRVQMRQDNDVAAKASFEKSLTADGKFVSPYMELAGLAAKHRDWPGALQYTNTLIRLNPYFAPDAYYYNAVANLELKQLDAAEASVRETLKMDTSHKIPKANRVLAIILARKNDFIGAATAMRAYLSSGPVGPDAEQARTEMSQIERFLASSQRRTAPAAAAETPAAPQ